MPPGLNRYVIPAGALLATFVVSALLVFAVASLVGGDSDNDEPPASAEATRTPALTAPTPTLTATAAPVMLTATPTPVPTLAPTATLAPPTPLPPTPAPPTLPPAPASFAGAWRIVDTVLQGRGAGQTYTFQVAITQSGSALSGGAAGDINLSGTVAGNIATVEFNQPGLGFTGIFIWTLGADGNAAGTFTSSVPNSGTSQLVRLR